MDAIGLVPLHASATMVAAQEGSMLMEFSFEINGRNQPFSRIAITLAHAKRLHSLLGRQLKLYTAAGKLKPLPKLKPLFKKKARGKKKA